jgi:phosphoglycolate phosphatase-like HAD superfamily hydrolase
LRHINDYDVVIFDCDGVILDSNELKIEAMHLAVAAVINDKKLIMQCVDYFRNNFGKSRYHHILHFVENIIKCDDTSSVYNDILVNYADRCYALYLQAEVTKNFKLLISKSKCIHYVASGSDQEELRKIFDYKGLTKLFKSIEGSPKNKSEIVKEIVAANFNSKILMIGDAESDFLAAQNNKIDFIFYQPLSTVKERMVKLSMKYKFLVINDFSELLNDRF